MNDSNPAIRRIAHWLSHNAPPSILDCWNDAHAEIARLRAALDAMTAERDAARAKALKEAASIVESCAWWGLWSYDGMPVDPTQLANVIRAMTQKGNRK